MDPKQRLGRWPRFTVELVLVVVIVVLAIVAVAAHVHFWALLLMPGH